MALAGQRSFTAFAIMIGAPSSHVASVATLAKRGQETMDGSLVSEKLEPFNPRPHKAGVFA